MDGYGYGAQPKRGISKTLYDRYQALLSGQMKPWELPEFKGMETRLQRIGALNRQGMGRQLTSMGVRGPAVGMALEKARETEMAPMGAAITKAYGEIPGRAMGVQMSEDAMYNAMQNRLLQAVLTKMGIHSQEKMAGKALAAQQAGGMAEGMQPCVLATACYGENSRQLEFFKLFRDFIIPQRILRGYYIFSDAILPLVKFKMVNRLVKSLIVNPLLRAGRWSLRSKSSSDIRLPVDLAISTVVLTFWKILGSRKPYTRKTGEIV